MILSAEMVDQLKILVEGGLTPAEIEAATGIPRKETVALKRAHRWKVDPSAVATREIDRRDVEEVERDQILTEADNDLSEAGEDHAKKLFATLSAHVLGLKKLPAIKTWKDLQIADSLVRRAARLDVGENGGGNKTVINLGVIAGGRMLPIATTPTPPTLENNDTPNDVTDPG